MFWRGGATDRTNLVARLHTHLSKYRDPQGGNSNLMGFSASHQWGLAVLMLKMGSSSCGGKQACSVPGKPPDPFSRLEDMELITSSQPLWAGLVLIGHTGKCHCWHYEENSMKAPSHPAVTPTCLCPCRLGKWDKSTHSPTLPYLASIYNGLTPCPDFI